MMKRRGWWLLVVLAASGTAWAQVPSASEAEHRRGMQLRVEGRHVEAAAVFRDIYAQTREPRALARQGLAEAAAERWVEADEHLRAALGYATDAWINTNRQNLARDLGLIEGHLGALEVRGPSGAEVRVNGVARGTLPLAAPLRVLAGPVSVELRAAGYTPATRDVTVTAGVSQPMVVAPELQRAVAVVTPPVVTPPVVTPPVVTPPVVTPPVVTPPVLVRRPDPVVTPPVVTPPPSTARWQLPLGIAGIGVGVGLIGLGVAGLVLRNDNATQFNATNAGRNYCGLNGSDQVVSLMPGSSVDCNGLYDAGRTWQSVSVAGFIAGGVFAALGTVLLVTRPSSRSGEHAAIRCGMGPGDIGIACGGTL